MNVDVIILANTKDLNLYGMTQRTINTLRLSETNHTFNINIVESNPNILDQGFVYHGCNVIIPKEEFGYNAFLNYGLTTCKNEWIVAANNDLIFTQRWFTQLMIHQGKHHNTLSMSPWEPNWHKKRGMSDTKEFYNGYRTSFEITGWCLVFNKDIVKKCELFDPRFKFWYQDNDYGLTLQKHNIAHALVTKSRVYHMVSGSHHLLNDKNKYNMTDGQLEILRAKWGSNV